MPLMGIRESVFLPRQGERIGEVHKGWVQLSDHPIHFTTPTSDQSLALNADIAAHLRTLGYPVVAARATAFPEALSDKPAVELGLVVQTVRVESFDRPESAYQRAEVECEWQVLDVSAAKVVYSSRASGVAQQAGFTSPVTLAAILNSLQRITGKPEFSAAVAQCARPQASPGQPSPASPPVATLRLIGARLRGIEEQFSISLQRESFVTIRSEDSVGSGFIITHDGYVLTAAHVVAGYSNVDVELESGVSLAAFVVRADRESDVALLRLPGSGFRPLSLQAQPPAIGSPVFTVGAPKDLPLTVTNGILSSTRRDGDVRLLQTDSSISPGSSGGALLDARGNAIGVVVSKAADSRAEGLGFAVGVEDALRSLRLEVARP